jgi:hypothetical protein
MKSCVVHGSCRRFGTRIAGEWYPWSDSRIRGGRLWFGDKFGIFNRVHVCYNILYNGSKGAGVWSCMVMYNVLVCGIMCFGTE